MGHYCTLTKFKAHHLMNFLEAMPVNFILPVISWINLRMIYNLWLPNTGYLTSLVIRNKSRDRSDKGNLGALHVRVLTASPPTRILTHRLVHARTHGNLLLSVLAGF